MDLKDWRQVIEDFWWEKYGKIHFKINNRTREEIEELARRINKAHKTYIRENFDDDV